MKAHLAKCVFGAAEVPYLGHEFLGYGTNPQAAKIEAIQAIASPRDVAGVRAFLGLAGYYRKFVPSYRSKAKPLKRVVAERRAIRVDRGTPSGVSVDEGYIDNCARLAGT